jgi:single-strand DNA-binding protein
VNDTIVTVVGNVVDSPRRVALANGAVTNFRMASTARRFDPGKEEFVDAGTFWVDVECWNTLSGNVSASVSKGDPVIVHGTLTTHSWESENGPRSKPRIRASAVGHSLSKGRALFTRDKATRSSEPADAPASGPLPPGAESAPDEEFPMPTDGLQAGRDYEVDAATLDAATFDTVAAGDLDREPANA